MIKLAVLFLVIFLLGCTPEPLDPQSDLVEDEKSDENIVVNEPEENDKSSDAEKSLPNDSEIIDSLYCNSNADCEIKNVGSCCGEYLSCVNKDVIPDVEAVNKRCEESGISSICDYPVLIYCACVKNKCVSNEQSIERADPIPI